MDEQMMNVQLTSASPGQLGTSEFDDFCSVKTSSAHKHLLIGPWLYIVYDDTDIANIRI